jgi:hypothetical protein
MQEPSIRYTIIDEQGTVSFTGPGHVLKVLAASCAKGAEDLSTLLRGAERYNAQFIQGVSVGLRIFEEHNVKSDAEQPDGSFDGTPPSTAPFRVIDELTRQMSMQPYGAGLVLFNLKARRIVQVQNSYANLERQGRGRIRQGGEPIDQLFYYKLPNDWSLVP